MPWYSVNATVSMAAWYDVEADSEDEALDIARSVAARDFECDPGTAEVELNVTPAVEVA